MSSKQFDTVLVPSTKTGKVQFYKKSTKEVIEADFARANTPEDALKSGRLVIDANGDFKELAANETPWTFPLGGSANGCPYLSFLPERAQLLKNTSDLSLNFTSADLTALHGVSDYFWGNRATRLTETGAGPNTAFQQTIVGSSAQDYVTGWFIKGISNYQGKVKLRCADLGTETEIFVTDEWQFFQLTDTSSSTTIRSAVILEIDSSAIVDVCFPMLYEGTSVSPLELYPTEGTALTRQADVLPNINFVANGYYPSKEQVSIFWQLGFGSLGTGTTSRFVLSENGGGTKITFRETIFGLYLFDLVNSQYVFVYGTNNFMQINELSKFVFNLSASGVEIWYNGQSVYTASGDFRVDEMLSNTPLAIDWRHKQMAFNPFLSTSDEAIKASAWATLPEMYSDLNYDNQ